MTITNWVLIVIALVCIVLLIRVKRRGFFWKDKYGNKLTLKEFFARWKKGLEGVRPVQQTKISLWSFIPLFGGIVWGMAVTFLSGTYWLTLILVGSLTLMSMNFVSTLQKYRAQKKAEELMAQAKQNTQNQETDKNGTG